MDTSAILTAIDEQIAKLEQAKAILVGVATPAESVPKKKPAPVPEPKHRGRPKGSVNKKAPTPEPVAAKAAKHTSTAPGAALMDTVKKARKSALKKAVKPAKSAAKKPSPVAKKKTATKASTPKPAKKSVPVKDDAAVAAAGTAPTT